MEVSITGVENVNAIDFGRATIYFDLQGKPTDSCHKGAKIEVLTLENGKTAIVKSIKLPVDVATTS